MNVSRLTIEDCDTSDNTNTVTNSLKLDGYVRKLYIAGANCNNIIINSRIDVSTISIRVDAVICAEDIQSHTGAATINRY